MKEEQYSALWVLVPLCALLVILTGGMLFLGWFAADFGFTRNDPILITAFTASVTLSGGIIGGYLAALRRKFRPELVRLVLTFAIATFVTGLTILFLIEGISGSKPSFVMAALTGFLATVFWLTIKRKRFRSLEKEPNQSLQPTAPSRRG